VMVVLLNTIGASEALYAYVTLNERLATEVSTIRRCDRSRFANAALPRLGRFKNGELLGYVTR
jgi:hypothetical protein